MAAGLVLLASITTATAEITGGCDDRFRAWLASCAEREGVLLTEDHCADGVAVIAASSGGQLLRIELSVGRPSIPIHVGQIGITPIGDFPDWNAAPADLRRSFDAVRACVEAHAPDIVPATQTFEIVEYGWRGVLAWSTIVGFVVFLIVAPPRRSRWAETACALSVVAVAAVVRRLAIAAAFFHQNGHGAGWVLMAQCRPSTYGPGYAALFHAPAMWGGMHGERAVFVAQEILALIAVWAVFAAARGLGNARPVAWACALAIGIEPLVGRLARSESYYATALWLLLMAIAAVLVPGTRGPVQHAWNRAGAALAGLLLALAVTVHPVAWVPAAFAPAVLVLRAGTRRERIVSALVAGVVIAAIGVAVALPSVIAVMHGALGAQWGAASPQGGQLLRVVALLAAPWVAWLVLPHRLVSWTAPLVFGIGAAGLDRLTNLFGPDTHIAPAQAWRLLFAATAMTSVLAWLASLGTLARKWNARATTWLAVLVTTAAVAHALVDHRAATLLPTDALETDVFAPWLQALPPTARLFHLERSGQMMQELPVYSRCGFAGPEVLGLDASEPPRAMLPGDYWFRSATCASATGREWCDAMERGVVLRPLHVERFPARPSLPYLPYDATEIVSGLYHVEALRQSP